jgi:hypothetical protein
MVDQKTGKGAQAETGSEPSDKAKTSTVFKADKESPTSLNDVDEVTAKHLQSNTSFAKMRHDANAIREIFENGTYPYHTKMKRQPYEKHKAELQVELL